MHSKKFTILYIGNKLSVHGRTPTSIDTLGRLFEQEGCTVIYSSSKMNKFARLSDMLSSIISKRKQADVVLIDTYSTAAFHFAQLCGRLCKLLSIPYIPILHGGNLKERLKKSPKLCRHFFGNSVTSVAVSNYMYEHMLRENYRCTLIENSVNVAAYKFTQRKKVKPNLLWVRAFHKTYNPQLAIEVLALLAKKYPKGTLTMVGPEVDGTQAKCKDLCQQKGLGDKVVFTGKLSKKEWAAQSEQSDIFINTTNYDNQPVTVIEAMALGLPVVSTNVGGIPYLIEDNKTGLLVTPDNATEMVAAIERLLADENLTTTLSENGRSHAAKFDWLSIRHKWQTVFETVK